MKPFAAALSFFLVLFLLLSTSSVRSSNSECSGRRIHIRDLPSRFNSDLLTTCDSFPLLSDGAGFCNFTSNAGLGPRTHNRSSSWFRTDPLLLELLFHRRLLEYPCLVADPDAADAVFLPYYAALDALPFLYDPRFFNSSATHGVELHRHLAADRPEIWGRRAGHDHFVVLAGPAWDFSQDPEAEPVLWGTSFLTMPEFQNITVLVLEARPRPLQERAIPYPTSFHPATLARLDTWLSRARSSPRDYLMLFAGGGAAAGGLNIRSSILSECMNRTDLCLVVDCSDGACTHNPFRFMLPMLRSRFCLQPPGDTPTRRSTFDAMIAGCVPVFFEDLSAKTQYTWHLPTWKMEEFSVTIPKEDVVFGGRRISDVLEGIPATDVRKMREKVEELALRVVYRRPGSSSGLREKGKDAVDIAVDGVIGRIKRRVAALHRPEWILLDDEDRADGGGWVD